MIYNTIKLEQNLKMKFIFTMFLSLLCRACFGCCFGAVFHRLVRVMLTFRTRQCTAAARYLFRRPRIPTGGAPHPGLTRRCGDAARRSAAREPASFSKRESNEKRPIDRTASSVHPCHDRPSECPLAEPQSTIDSIRTVSYSIIGATIRRHSD